MPKIIFSDFSGGMSDQDRNLPMNQFAVGDGLDIHTMPGYILPSVAISTVTKSNDSPQVIESAVLDSAIDLSNGKVYHITSARLIQETSIGGGAFNSNFDGGGNSYKAITSVSLSYFGENRLVMYKTNDTPYLFYAYGLASGFDIGRYDLSSTFDDDFMSTVPTGSSTFASNDQKARHPLLEWNSLLWFGNGRYLGKYDGTSAGGTNGTVYATHLDLGAGWEITALFPTGNYVGIIARRSSVTDGGLSATFSRVFFYDGVSDNYNYFIELSEHLVEAITNSNGRIFLVGNGRNTASQFMQLSQNGSDILANLKVSVAGTYKNFGSGITMATLRDRVLFNLSTTGAGVILSYGRNKATEQNALSFPFLVSTATSVSVRMVKQVTNNIFYIGWYDGSSVYYLSKFDLSGSTYGTAKYKPGYIDFGQKVRVNYAKFYFKPLVSGDSVTPTIDTDYGTSNALKDPNGNTTISFTNDKGVITGKKFKTALDCHAFRPALSWTSGGTAFSKIEVDFSYLKDDV